MGIFTKHLKLFVFLLVMPALVALGPCDNGELPGDPLNPADSTNTKVTPPEVEVKEPNDQTEVPEPSEEPEEEETESSEAKILDVVLVDDEGNELTQNSVYALDEIIHLELKFTWDDGSEDFANANYEGESIQWLSTSESVLKKLNNRGTFKAVGEGQSIIMVYHPLFKGQIKLKVQN